MTDDNWKTLRVPAEAYKEAKATKEAEDRTWGQQLTAGDDGDDALTFDDVQAACAAAIRDEMEGRR